jgi:hypothetical protein
MSLTRAYEEHEVTPKLRRVYGDVRSSFDLPFVPTLFKVTAGIPEYLCKMWQDLGPVCRSKEFQAAARALQEITHSAALSGGWDFSEQSKMLASERFSNVDMRVIGGMLALFHRALTQGALCARLMQRGYSCGQQRRVSASKQVPALSQVVQIHEPNGREAGLRVLLIYAEFKRATGAQIIPGLYRYPGYMASAWLDSQKLFHDPSFINEGDELGRRARALLTGLAVKDHRALLKNLDAAKWQEIEETVDSFACLLLQFVLLTALWERALPGGEPRLIGAA